MIAGFEKDLKGNIKELEKDIADLQKKGPYYPATIVRVIDDSTVVINRGSKHGALIGDEFLVYELSTELIKDPTDGHPLGYLEIPKGTGKVVHVQEEMATIESNKKEEEKTIIKNPSQMWPNASMWSYIKPDREVVEISYKQVPFKHPQVGDKAKPVG